MTQQMVDSTAAAIPTCAVSILEGTGHYPMIEHPVEFNAAVEEFLDQAL